MKAIFMTVLAIGCVVDLGCVTYQQQTIWHELSAQSLIVEVEHKSRPDQIWRYSGSNQSHHYLYRASVNYFCFGRRYDYFKVMKKNCTWLPVEGERQYMGKPAGFAVVFSKRADAINSFTHLVSRGIVHDPFNDGGSLPQSLTDLLEDKK